MTEPSVRVAVSLIESAERLAGQLESNADAHQETEGTERRRAAAMIRALLSQPTPTLRNTLRGCLTLDDDGNYRWDNDALDRLLEDQPTPNVEPDREPCAAETHSWDHFRPEQVDSYWITCDLVGPHDEHEDQHTGLTWRDPSTIRDVTPTNS